MTGKNKTARLAGLIYLGVVVTGIFSLLYVPDKLIAYDNAALTFQNISASADLFRLGIAGGLACYLFFLFLPLVLYKLLQPIDTNMAKLMVLLAVISVPMYFMNVQHELTTISLITNPHYFPGQTAAQIQSQILFHINQYDDGMRLIHVFSGLWLFPLGYLVFYSEMLPKFLGILLILGCFGYLVNFFGRLLLPDYSQLGIARYISLPASLGEIGTCLWLLLVGVKEKQTLNNSTQHDNYFRRL